MKNKAFQSLMVEWFNKKIELNTMKSNDYASDEETLKNFKQMADVLNSYDIKLPFTPAKWALIMCLMKIQRLFNIIQNYRIPSNETLTDTLQDLSLYADLGRACLYEESNQV